MKSNNIEALHDSSASNSLLSWSFESFGNNSLLLCTVTIWFHKYSFLQIILSILHRIVACISLVLTRKSCQTLLFSQQVISSGGSGSVVLRGFLWSHVHAPIWPICSSTLVSACLCPSHRMVDSFEGTELKTKFECKLHLANQMKLIKSIWHNNFRYQSSRSWGLNKGMVDCNHKIKGITYFIIHCLYISGDRSYRRHI